MGNFSRGGFGRGRDDRGFGGGGFRRGGFSRGGFGGGGGFGDRGDRQMYDAVCDNCGKDCKVPFQPTQGKPIYCSQCFEDKGGGNHDDRGDRGGRRDSRPMTSGSASCDCKACCEALNVKLDKIIKLLSPVEVQAEVKVEKKEEKKEKKTAQKKVVVKKEASVKES